MSKPVQLSETAHKALCDNKETDKESLSSVILRFVPKRLETFEDLEAHLKDPHGPVIDLEALERIRQRKAKAY